MTLEFNKSISKNTNDKTVDTVLGKCITKDINY